jgi:hypothetical protein
VKVTRKNDETIDSINIENAGDSQYGGWFEITNFECGLSNRDVDEV